MANRVLRDWTASEAIDGLSEGAEIFFTRLIMKADDFGCYYGNPKLLNSAMFPLRNYSLDKILKWRNECRNAGVIKIYRVDGKEYVKIENFGQRLRIMNSKFPQPSEGKSLTNDSVSPPSADNGRPETKRNEVEGEIETEVETETVVWPLFEDFWSKYDKKRGKPKAEELWEKIDQAAREKIMSHLDKYRLVEKQFRKDPERYLRNKSWEDEVIIKQHDSISNKTNPRRPDAVLTPSASGFGTF